MKLMLPVSKITVRLFEHFFYVKKNGNAVKLPKYVSKDQVHIHDLYAQVLNNRGAFRSVIEDLCEIGLEDPFEEGPEIAAYVEMLVERFRPQSDLETAVTLFRSVIPSLETFQFASEEFRGIKAAERGLNVLYNRNADAYLRWQVRPCLLPKDIIRAPSEKRIAMCYEYGFLLTALLRAAGIKAHLRKGNSVEHIEVVAQIGKEKYILNAVSPSIKSANGSSENDVLDNDGVAFFYFKKGEALWLQNRLIAAIQASKLSLEIKPDLHQAWRNISLAYVGLNDLEGALSAVETSLTLNPGSAINLHNKGKILGRLGRDSEARSALEKAREINPYLIAVQEFQI